MENNPKEILNYITPDGKIPFEEWLNSLRDINARTKIKARLRRVELGNLGDYKTVGGGVCELRINYVKVTEFILGKSAQSLLFFYQEEIKIHNKTISTKLNNIG
jgi:putative addiction module killer protein